MSGATGGALLVGVDVGGSKIAVLVTDAALDVCARHTIATGIGEAHLADTLIARAIDTTLRAAGADRLDLAAIGIGVPGRVDPEAGSVTLAVNLGWHDLPLGPLLAGMFGVPVAVENDVRAAAAGLHERRVLGDGEDLAYLSIGTGVSAGVVLDGRLHRGARGMAGEIGHVVIDEQGPACPCGLRGCFEALASGPAVAQRAEEALERGVASTLAGHRPVTAVDLYRAAADGDPLALDIAEGAGRHVARAIHQLVMAYDVRRVVLGGGVAAAGATFLAPIERGLDLLRSASELAREALPADVVHLLPADAEAGAWGAVMLARSRLAGHPGRRWSHENA
jgi:predicted NBD/HSP70 family sugar kinase